MTHQIEASVKVHLSLVDDRWVLAPDLRDDATRRLDSDTYCSQGCVKHRGVTADAAMPNVYELMAMLSDEFLPPYTTRLVYLDASDTLHGAWTLEQAKRWAVEHIQAGFPLATVTENGAAVEAFRHADYTFDADGEPTAS